MPNLALSRTARTLNSWSPVQGDAVTSPTVNPKDDLIIPNDGSFDAFPSSNNNNTRPAFRATSYDIKSSRRRQNRMLEVSRERFQYLDGSGRGPVLNGNNNDLFDVESQGFASQPVPSYNIPLSHLNGDNKDIADGAPQFEKEDYIPSTNNRDVRFQVRGTPLKRGQRFANHSINVYIKYIWMEPSLSCSSPLILAANSTLSLSHLRKWNSQPCLRMPRTNTKMESTSKRHGSSKEFPNAKAKALLKRNESLPDLRQAKQLDATKLHKARPKTEISDTLLIRSPSDTGRSLTFWMVNEEDGQKSNGAIKSFTETTAFKRASLETKLLVFKNHWFNQITAPTVKVNGKLDDWSKDENSTDLSDFSAKSLAEELTLLGRELLLAVEPVELVTYVMKPKMSSEETCPNLFRLLRFYERTTSLVATEILKSDNATKRAQIIALIIEAAEKCRLMQNWQSSKALLAGIQCPPVARLENTWTQLRQQYPDHNSTFECLATDEYGKDDDNEGEKHRQLAAMPYFGDVLSRVRGRPTISRLRPARPLWKEPPSLAKWVEEQISIALTCDTCNSTVHKNRACCYLMVFVLGKNVFCPVRKMPEAFVQNGLTANSDYMDNCNFRLDLAKVFDDPESLPFTSPHIQCSALQPQNTTEVRHRSEIYLRSAQATARAYDLECNQRARNYLLKRPYHSLLDNMKRSLEIEPSKHKKTS